MFFSASFFSFITCRISAVSLHCASVLSFLINDSLPVFSSTLLRADSQSAFSFFRLTSSFSHCSFLPTVSFSLPFCRSCSSIAFISSLSKAISSSLRPVSLALSKASSKSLFFSDVISNSRRPILVYSVKCVIFSSISTFSFSLLFRNRVNSPWASIVVRQN